MNMDTETEYKYDIEPIQDMTNLEKAGHRNMAI